MHDINLNPPINTSSTPLILFTTKPPRQEEKERGECEDFSWKKEAVADGSLNEGIEGERSGVQQR